MIILWYKHILLYNAWKTLKCVLSFIHAYIQTYLQVHLKKIEYREKKNCNLFQKVILSYIHKIKKILFHDIQIFWDAPVYV